MNAKYILNAKDILKKIKAVFEEVPAPDPVLNPAPAEFKEYALADGTKVKIDKLEIGGKVMVVGADGSEVKAPEGEHMLATGEAIEVDAEGLIYEIKSAVAAQPDMMAQLAEQFNALKTEFQEVKDELKKKDETIGKMKQGFKELVELVETIAEIPAEGSTEPQRSQFFEPLDERQRKILAAQQGFEKLKS